MHAKLGPKGIVKRSRRDKIIYGPHADLCTLVVSRISGSVRRAGSETTCSERDSLGARIQCLHFPLIFHRTSSGKNVVIVNSLSGIYPKQNKTKSGYSTRGITPGLWRRGVRTRAGEGRCWHCLIVPIFFLIFTFLVLLPHI